MSAETLDSLGAVALILVIWAAVMGPMLVLLWHKLRQVLRALIVLRDRIDRSRRWP